MEIASSQVMTDVAESRLLPVVPPVPALEVIAAAQLLLRPLLQLAEERVEERR